MMRLFTLPSELSDEDTSRFIKRGLLSNEDFCDSTRLFFGSYNIHPAVALSIIRSDDAYIHIQIGEEFEPGERIVQYERGNIIDRYRFGEVLEVTRRIGTNTHYLVKPDKPDIPTRWWRNNRKPRVWDGDGTAPPNISEPQTT